MTLSQPTFSTLVAIRGAHHPETTPKYDRVVFEFKGPVPQIEIKYVKELIEDGSGFPVVIKGSAILAVRFTPAQAHTSLGQPSAPKRVALTLPLVKEVVDAGDFEAVVTYGVGVMQRAEVRNTTMVDASRVVVDFLV